MRADANGREKALKSEHAAKKADLQTELERTAEEAQRAQRKLHAEREASEQQLQADYSSREQRVQADFNKKLVDVKGRAHQRERDLTADKAEMIESWKRRRR